LILSPDEMMVGGSSFLAAEAVILGVPASSNLLRVKLMVLNYVKM
jgi:predicted glycosyltransferase